MMFATLLLATIPFAPVIESRVDVIELNHFYSDEGRHVFDQLIFWTWDNESCRFQVVAWKLRKCPMQVPVGGRLTWMDGLDLRRVRSASVRETWSQYDPELEERAVIPSELRRGL